MIRDALIMAGGSFDRSDIKCLKTGISHMRNPLYIAADKGIENLAMAGIEPDIWIGDFDSVDESYEREKEKELSANGKRVIKLNPIKDDTDTEAALNEAIKNTDGSIYIYGAQGGRTDHTIANIHILQIPLKAGRACMMVSKKSVVRLTDKVLRLKKYDFAKKYVSIFPFASEAKGVTLTGFKYPLMDATLSYGTSLGQSNEIVEAYGIIDVKEGMLLVIQADD